MEELILRLANNLFSILSVILLVILFALLFHDIYVSRFRNRYVRNNQPRQYRRRRNNTFIIRDHLYPRDPDGQN